MSISARYRYTMGENMITRISSEQRYNIIWLLSRYFPFFFKYISCADQEFFPGAGIEGEGSENWLSLRGIGGPGGGGVEAYFE